MATFTSDAMENFNKALEEIRESLENLLKERIENTEEELELANFLDEYSDKLCSVSSIRKCSIL
jgi:predicted Zn-dependent peptidase